ncbi:dipeptide ABC transporter ATP-binding protein [Roseomonas sp. BN140053]|uniref:dipeptide ABC transporter ATP-binding protein n=1 Tax=Roseomonas sp. BN140053 TaxID=3391898 RepID=UPI0039E7AE2F
MTELLAVRDLSLAIGRDGSAASVLKDLSFTLPEGRVLGLVGESGAGKSMIGRVIAGDLPPGFRITGGELRFRGRDMLAATPAQRRGWMGREIAFIPQEPQSALNPVRSVGSQFDEHLRHLGLRSATDRRARMLALLESVHLARGEELLGRYPHQLSGGMCQRVLIAMAFAGEPRLVVADEPTTALDVTVQSRIVEVLAELQARHGTGVIFITHDLRLAGQVCDEILVLYAGRPVEHGAAAEVLGAPQHPYTRCLLLANPPVRGPARALFTLPDQMPGVRSLATLAGCRFAARCPVAQPDCARVEPPLSEPRQPGHAVACLHPDSTPRIQPPALVPYRVVAAAAGTRPVLEVTGLSKHYPARSGLFRHGAGTVALHPASFTVGEGEFLGVVGESGSGKSTVARLVVGLEPPSAGRIVLDGVDVSAMSGATRAHRARATQMVFQNPQSALNPRRRVGRIVTQALEVVPGDGTPRQQRARELLAAVGLGADTGERFPFQLSGGQRQRVNIARALCVLPRLLVADEIASGLDVSVQAQLLALLLRLREELGFAMLFISHDLSVVRHLCDRVLVMQGGVIVEEGRTADVFAQPQHPYTRRLLDAVPPDEPVRRPLAAATAA